MNTFKPNRAAEGLLARTPRMLALLKEQAERAAARARALAPVGDSQPGEHYRDMIEADVGIDGGKATGRVNAKKWTSHFVEFGTIHNPPHAVLRRAVESLGLRFRSKR